MTRQAFILNPQPATHLLAFRRRDSPRRSVILAVAISKRCIAEVTLTLRFRVVVRLIVKKARLHHAAFVTGCCVGVSASSSSARLSCTVRADALLAAAKQSGGARGRSLQLVGFGIGRGSSTALDANNASGGSGREERPR